MYEELVLGSEKDTGTGLDLLTATFSGMLAIAGSVSCKFFLALV